MEYLSSIIGYTAATLTTVSFVPQVMKVWQSKSTKDVSLGMYAFFTLGVAMWLVYGLLVSAWPVVIANAITLLLAGAVLVMKLKYK